MKYNNVEEDMKVKSNRFKCRNLPKNYEVRTQIKSKPVFMLIVGIIVGCFLLLQKTSFFVGIFLIGMGIFGLLSTKNPTTVEFSNQFMVFYLDDRHEDCYLIYYDDIDHYDYKRKIFDTDVVSITLKNRKVLEFKSLDRHKILKYLDKNVRVEIEDDEE